MGSNGINKKTIAIIVIIIIAAILILYLTVLKKSSKVEYNLTTSISASKAESTLFKDYESFQKFIEKNKLLKME